MRAALATFHPATTDRLRFTRQLGLDDGLLWGPTLPPDLSALDYKALLDIRGRFEGEGLSLYAIETLPAAFMRDIILGGPRRDQHLDELRRLVGDMGRAGIGVFGYNWMPDGVWRTSNSHPLRGGAKGTASVAADLARAPIGHGREFGEDEIWANYAYFLHAVVPEAEAAGVRLALHPNDAPVPSVGGVPALFSTRAAFERALAIVDSPANALCLCLGNWGAMGEKIPEVIRDLGPRGKIVYVHFQAVQQNIRDHGRFNECFVDEADNDALDIMLALHETGFDGVMIPGHVPQMEGDDEWRTVHSSSTTPYTHPMGGHRARAFTVGYLRGLAKAVERLA
ncbi:mannonate dehydratase [Streptomyces sp. NPDC060194]|uniref:mannonate dehydratase n=1 Tax=Streptomyces sp. NPDC060194 TaxID=3347069 RepID=UPI0036490C3F